MKLSTYFLTVITSICLGVCIGVIMTLNFYQNKIELPEEYSLISKDINHPDTLLGVFNNKGKLIMSFKKNNYQKTY